MYIYEEIEMYPTKYTKKSIIMMIEFIIEYYTDVHIFMKPSPGQCNVVSC